MRWTCACAMRSATTAMESAIAIPESLYRAKVDASYPRRQTVVERFHLSKEESKKRQESGSSVGKNSPTQAGCRAPGRSGFTVAVSRSRDAMRLFSPEKATFSYAGRGHLGGEAAPDSLLNASRIDRFPDSPSEERIGPDAADFGSGRKASRRSDGRLRHSTRVLRGIAGPGFKRRSTREWKVRPAFLLLLPPRLSPARAPAPTPSGP